MRQRGIRAAGHGVRARMRERLAGDGEAVRLQQAIGIGEKQHVAATVPRAGISGLGGTTMLRQADKPAGKTLNHLPGIVLGAVVNHDHLEVIVAGGQRRRQALADRGRAVAVGDDDRDGGRHVPLHVKVAI